MIKVGQKYNNLTVLSKLSKNRYLMRCDCGNTYERTAIAEGKLTHCIKCTNYDYRIIHGDHKTRLNQTWRTMRSRCSNPNAFGYKYYGGKGITVCEEWQTFVKFREWALQNGYKENLTIERKDSNKNYCPENCCWIPQSLQQKTSSNSKLITVNNITLNHADWARRLGIHVKSIQYAINTCGIPAEKYIRSKLALL